MPFLHVQRAVVVMAIARERTEILRQLKAARDQREADVDVLCQLLQRIDSVTDRIDILLGRLHEATV